MDIKKQRQHQKAFFNKEFGKIKDYDLSQWKISYIDRIKQYLLDKNYKKKKLLDIATGSGYVAIEMAKLGLEVTACDLSRKSIENLEKFKNQFNLKSLNFIECKAEKIPLQDKSFDYIVANAILEHIPDEEGAIREWKRLLRPGGRLFITVPLKFRYVWPILWIPNYIHDQKIGHLRRYDFGDLKKKFRMKSVKVFYTGHLIKILSIVIAIFTKSNKYERYFEILDNKKVEKRYGANNITVIFQNE